MGLDLIPTHDPCVIIEQLVRLPGIRVDRKVFACPLKDKSRYHGPLASSCSCRGKIAASELSALGEGYLADKLYEDHDPDGARELGEALLSAAVALDSKHAAVPDKPNSAWGKTAWDAQAKTVAITYSTLEEALAAIEDAGHWLIACADVGSGVHAWY